MVGCGFWTAWVDQRQPMLHGVLTSLLTALGAASLVLVLSIPPDTWLSWPAAILCMILDGWFFQPLGCLIDSSIIKILGDYKLLFESERRWGKLSLGITALGIGCFLDDDHDFDTLMGTVVIGCAALFLLSLSTTVQPADPFLLGLPPSSLSEEDPPSETSPLLISKSSFSPPYLYGDDSASPHRPSLQQSYYSYNHHHHHHHHHHHYNAPPPSSKNNRRNNGQDYYQYQETVNEDIYNAPRRPSITPISLSDSTSSPYYHRTYSSYKPYNTFCDHLSHISEEDVSMLQRIPSTRAPSVISATTKHSLNHQLDNSVSQFRPMVSTIQPLSPPTPLPCNPSDTPSSPTINTSTASLESQQSPRSPIPSSRLAAPPPPPLSVQYHTIRKDGELYPSNNDSPTTSNTLTVTSSPMDTTFKSMALALLPFPPGEIPMIVLITLFPRLRPDSFQRRQHPRSGHYDRYLERDKNNTTGADNDDNDDDDDDDDDDEQQPYYVLIMASCFILGLLHALMNIWAPLIYCDYFGLPMHTIGLMILVGCLSDIAITHCAPLALEHVSLRLSVLLGHLVLMGSIFVYAWMPMGQQWWSVICLFVLHIAQSSCIQMIWLMASCQVDLLFLPQCQDRMMLRGKMSALYSSLGPAVGSVVLGWLVSLDWSMSSIYLFALVLPPISASLTLGWS